MGVFTIKRSQIGVGVFAIFVFLRKKTAIPKSSGFCLKKERC